MCRLLKLHYAKFDVLIVLFKSYRRKTFGGRLHPLSNKVFSNWLTLVVDLYETILVGGSV